MWPFVFSTAFVSDIISRLNGPIQIENLVTEVNVPILLLGAAALSAQSIMPKFLPEINKMNFVLKTKDKNISVPLEQPQKLWSQSDFKKDLPLVVMITGWKTNFNETNDALDTVFNAYKCRGNVNFVVSTNETNRAISSLI